MRRGAETGSLKQKVAVRQEGLLVIRHRHESIAGVGGECAIGYSSFSACMQECRTPYSDRHVDTKSRWNYVKQVPWQLQFNRGRQVMALQVTRNPWMICAVVSITDCDF